MKYIVYLTTLLLFSTAVAQNPTILQGNYISNVFGQSNFVKNPNAQTSVTNVTLTTATATRSTTTPLVATTEWNVTITSANGTVAWETRTFDAGMKNQNCEARFTYRGFQATSKAQIKQGANVVAELVLTPSATDPRIASINFPCGDLSSATTFVITDTATLAGTNEIGGIYVGLATNQANVAQAEVVLNAVRGLTFQSIPHNANTTLIFDSVRFDKDGAYNSGTGIFTVKRAGIYKIESQAMLDANSCGVGGATILKTIKNGVELSRSNNASASVGTYQKWVSNTFSVTADVGDTLYAQFYQNCGTALQLSATTGTGFAAQSFITITRFPSSSELVVTPETQNVWGGVVYTNQTQLLFSGTADPTAFSPYTNATWNQPALLKGKAAVTTTNSGNDLGFSISSLPVGNYKLDVTGLLNSSGGGGTTIGTSVICNFKLVETTTSTDVARQIHQDQQYGTAVGNETRGYVNAFSGVFTNTSVATRNFRIEAQKRLDSTPTNTGNCQAYSATSGTNNSNLAIIMTPLDNNANSALYVQGPVKAAGTGTAIPSGYVGQYLLSVLGSDKALTSSNTYVTLSNETIPAGVYQLNMGAYAVWGTAQPNLTRIGIRAQKIAGTGTINNNSFAAYYPCENMWPSTLTVYRIDLACKPIYVTSDGTLQIQFQYQLNGTSAGNNGFLIDLLRLN